jgi:hypothetical protein
MFDDSDVVHVTAPSGMSAFNVFGETLDRFAGLDYRNTKKDMTQKTEQQLEKNLQNTIAILTDERSMISQLVLGLAEKAVTRTTHESGHSFEERGGSHHCLVWRGLSNFCYRRLWSNQYTPNQQQNEFKMDE